MDTSGSETFVTNSHGSESTKFGSCTRCRTAKVKCRRPGNDNSIPCIRCTSSNLTCETISYRSGRKRGSKNRRSRSSVVASLRPGADLAESSTQAMDGSLSDPIDENAGQARPLSNAKFSILDTETSLNPLGYLTNAVEELQVDAFSSRGPPRANTLFFGLPRSRLDVGMDKDPISTGIIHYTEAVRLFEYYRAHLTGVRFGLDPEIYTLDYMRCRSALLFTASLAGAAKFIQGAAELSSRLSAHVQSLLQLVLEQGYRSIEIAFSFLFIAPWLAPGEHISDDPTAQYVALCINMALALHMDKNTTTDETISDASSLTLSVEQILAIDGLDDISLGDPMIRRLVRSRQRMWYCMYFFDRAVAMARGRPYIAPSGKMLSECETWHTDESSLPQDTIITAIVTLYRDYGTLIEAIHLADERAAGINVEASIITLIDDYFSSWHAQWDLALAEAASKAGSTSPYPSIIVAQIRLSAYAMLLGSRRIRTASTLLRQAGRQAAIALLEQVVAHKTWIRYAHNQTVIMIAFAVSWVIKDHQEGYTPAVGNSACCIPQDHLDLINKVLDVLFLIGSQPEHRNGYGTVYSAHLRALLWRLNTDRVLGPPLRDSPLRELLADASAVGPQTQHELDLGCWLDWLR
ncbi:hypothetical protein BD324DRAFT_624432 [Kockovaella imperatae]|uniref:Zn(2)-C6 fungal-type domain-containing protein n=1 Tax=Kockovaella imperatae TaxID=4999 RepID=A0A1Y1UJ47_9TREE|nr:hypothetical protein BD324DRAFT_624432 [Kockovaella imperatae]ORX38080.1 hypothetical protein BD324DRAFT_624432 [Kockovaella imperatae]